MSIWPLSSVDVHGFLAKNTCIRLYVRFTTNLGLLYVGGPTTRTPWYTSGAADCTLCRAKATAMCNILKHGWSHPNKFSAKEIYDKSYRP